MGINEPSNHIAVKKNGGLITFIGLKDAQKAVEENRAEWIDKFSIEIKSLKGYPYEKKENLTR